MLLPKRKLFTSNILICMAITLFMCFLLQTSFLHWLLFTLHDTLFRLQASLLLNKKHIIPSPKSLGIDLSVLVACAYFWTYQKTVGKKIGWSMALGIFMIPISIYLFNTHGLLILSVPIVIGVTIGIALDSSREIILNRFHRKIVEEKHDAEYNILRHLNHNVRPSIQMAKSPINAVTSFLESRGILNETLARRLDGSNETVGEALQHALVSLGHINDILDSTRKLVTHEIRREDFQEVNICELFGNEVTPLFATTFPISVLCNRTIKIRLHKQSFVEAVLNIIRNAEIHGFPEERSNARLTFHIAERRKSIVIDYTNNGRPFPENLDEKDFLTFGKKSGDSPGEGLGGAWIGKVIMAHNGSFEIIRDEHPLHFRIMLPKGGI